jgi:hypothetical protein
VVGVADDGSPRAAELVPQLLQRPALSADGRIAAFSATAPNLVAGDTNGREDVFLRLLDAPQTDLVAKRPGRRPVVTLKADDPAATRFVCQLDRGPLFGCAPGRNRLPAGHRVLRVRAGGPGMLYDPKALVVSLVNERRPPRVAIAGFGRGPLRAIRGRAWDRSGIARVLVAVTYFHGRGCQTLAGRRFKRARCPVHVFQRASGRRFWTLRLPHAIRGPVVVYARAVDGVGNRSRVAVRKAIIG